MRISRCVVAAVAGGLLVAACHPGGEQAGTDQPVVRDDRKADGSRQDPLGPNAACYVCHTGFVGEELTRRHVSAQIGCIECHGTSAGHANDENIGATSPDKVYRRDQVSAFCRACHGKHDVAPERVVAAWSQRRQNGWVTDTMRPAAVCTDCHGEHRITR